MFKDFRARAAAGLGALTAGPLKERFIAGARDGALKQLQPDFIPADMGGGMLDRLGGSYVPEGLWAGAGAGGLDFSGLVGDLWLNSAVAAGINWIITTFGEARAGTWEKGAGNKLVVSEGDPLGLNALLDSPNPDYDDSVLWAGTLISWNVNGNAYWFIVRNAAGEPAGLDYIPHFLVEPRRDPGSRALVDYYEYRPGAGLMPVRREKRDVVHFRFGVDPRDPMKGLSPLAAVAGEVYTDTEAAQYGAFVLRNKGILGGLATPDSETYTFEPDEFVRNYQSKTTGSRRGEILAYDGPIKLQFPDTSPAKMDISALRRYPEARIAGVMGLPAVLLQLVVGLEKSHYNNVEQARRAGWEDNLLPTLRVMGKQATRQLVRQMPRDGGRYHLGFDTSGVRALQPDADALHERARQDFQANLLTRAEARGEIGVDSEPGRDDKFFADVAPPASQGFDGPEPAGPADPKGPGAPPRPNEDKK